MRTHHLAARLGGLTVAAASLFAFACGERFDVPEPAATPEVEPGRIGVATPARYLTTLAFVGAGRQGRQLYVRFANRASETGLARDYGGWLAGPTGWARLLALRDTLPVPRAAWRVLPSEELRVMVGDDAEVSGLLFRGDAGPLQLTPSGVIGEWTGLTGQRARLGLASLDAPDSSEAGLLFFRRAARPATAPESADLERVLLLADSLGNGLLVEVVLGQSGPSASAWTWVEGIENSWSEVRLTEPDAASAAASGEGAAGLAAGAAEPDSVAPLPSAWRIEIPNAEAAGEIRLLPAVRPPAGPLLPRERVYLLEGELAFGEVTLALRGVGVDSPLP